MRTLKITLQYDGTNYVGWQRQTAGASVQGVLEEALARIEGGRVVVHGAGRTDAGVHALAQVATVALAAAITPRALTRALNAVLPADVRVLAVEEVAPSFHARFSAVGKVYEYRIVNAPIVSPFLFRYVWHVGQPLDAAAMREAARLLVGAHDFAVFQGARATVRSTERVVWSIDWEGGGGHELPLVMRIHGDGFLRHMVRTIAGTLVDVGAGRVAPSRVAAILASRDRVQAGPTAPPHGLFLVRVDY
jgi:tRNA pseudouridine38-40 synthase